MARPNILLLFPDQHRGDWVGFRHTLGVETPNLDALATQGAVFSNAYTPSPLCSPARACLASGRAYDKQAVKHNAHDFDPRTPTIYRALRSVGYHVLACGKFDLLKHSMDWGWNGMHGAHSASKITQLGFTGGVDNAGKHDFITAVAQKRAEPYHRYLRDHGWLQTHLQDFLKRRSADGSNYTFTAPTPLPDNMYCDNWIGANGLDLLNEINDQEPWFLQVNFNGPHEPVDVTHSMHKHWQNRSMAPVVLNTQYSEPAHQSIRRNYAAMIENIDRHIGLYRRWLQEHNLLKNTVVVYASDHGEMLGDHALWGKVVPNQPSVHIPMVMAGPQIPQMQNSKPVDLTDLAFTLLELAEAPKLDDMTGCSLFAGPTRSKLLGLGSWRALVNERFKYVHNFSYKSPRNVMREPFDAAEQQPCGLYDLQNDPNESHNLSNSQPVLRDELRRELLANL